MRLIRNIKTRLEIAFIAVILFCVFLPPLSAQNTKKAAEQQGFRLISILERAESLLGDRNSIKLTAEYPDSFKPFGTAAPDLGADIEVFDIEASKPVSIGEGRSSITLTIKFAVFKTGEIALQPVTMRFKGKSGATVECVSVPLTLHIKSLVTDKDKDIKDIKGPISVENGPALWVLILIAAAAAGLIAAVILLLRKRKKSDVGESLLPADPPHIEAYKALDTLSRENLLAKGDYKRYYVLLSEIIRKYMSRRFEIDTLEQTTKEIFRQIEKLELTREVRNQFKEFMNQCDLVKFAKYIPTGSQARESLETAYYIVDVTREETIIASATSPAEEKHPAPVV